MNGKDYYQTLGVDREASQQQVKEAYRRLAFQYHPDRNMGDAGVTQRMMEINEAYAVLGDPKKRKQYDQFGTVGNIGDIFSSFAHIGSLTNR